MSEVATLLARGRIAKPNVSALDAVMGRDWAILSPGRPRKTSDVRLGLRVAHKKDVARFTGGGGTAPGGKPQAVVKMIRSGGVSDLRGLRTQMAYLSRKGEARLERSERYMGLDIDDGHVEAMERSWRMPREGQGTAERTSHFIASFPGGTDRRAAYQTGRDWAETMFGSGLHGRDRYDYYTAFHTDRDHPHMHVIVHRRGLENGGWLKVSKRSDVNYDRMRELLVEVAARSGIYLEASTRFSRGRHDRPVPDAEYRRAAAGRREPQAPAHTRETAIRAAAALIHYSRVFAADAKRIERETPEQAELLRRAATELTDGRALERQTNSARTAQQENKMASPRIEEKRIEVRSTFDDLDRGAREIEDRAVRMRFLRQVAAMKAETAPLLREPGELRAYVEKDDGGRYRGFDTRADLKAADKRRADDRVRSVAARYGLDDAATVERHAGPPPSRGLARLYAEAEAEERSRARSERGEAAETPDQRQAALSKMHAEIRSIYRESHERLNERGASRGFRPEPGRSALSEASVERRSAEPPEDLSDRVEARLGRDAQRVAVADGIWKLRDMQHRTAMTRETADERGQMEREGRKRGTLDLDAETRNRGRRR